MANWLPNDLFYSSFSRSDAAGRHPYAPMEEIEKGIYKLEMVMISTDGATPAEVTDCDVVIDVPDVFHTAGPISIGQSATIVPLPAGKFRSVNAVQVTVRDDLGLPGNAVTARILFRDPNYVMVETLDASGNGAAGYIDLLVVGY